MSRPNVRNGRRRRSRLPPCDLAYARRVTSLRRLAEAALAWLVQVGADARDDEETRLRKALLVVISVLILPISLVWGTLYVAFGAQSGYVAYLYFAILLGAIAVFARTRDFAFLLRVALLDILLAPTLSMIPIGGFLGSGGVGLWGILAPLGALVFGGVRAGIRWYIAFLAVFLASGIAGETLRIPSPLPAWFLSTMLALNVVVGGTIVFTLLALFAKQRQDALIALRSEQERAENLLLNILPRSIAERLKAQPQTIADHFAAASILFADVVDFTPHSEHLPPATVVGILDDLFSHFDALAERYGLEKIKTIGDCYMVAAGVPSPRPDHARAVALMALDMLDGMRAGSAVGNLGLELRVGINSGPVVAGVIGRKRFSYDLWGDAVNTASRMESQGTPGRIQIARGTYEMLRRDFICEPRGTVAVKGKGEMETWYLVGPRPTNGEQIA
jgi:adenylate cyclase